MANHVLFFISNGPREGKAAQMMENSNALKAYWTKKKAAGEIESFESEGWTTGRVRAPGRPIAGASSPASSSKRASASGRR